MKYVLALLALASPLQAQVLRQNSVGVSSGTAFGAFVQKAGDTMTGGLVTTSVTVNGTTLVTSGVNVGIGNASPATKLHMSSGTLTIDGTSPKLIVGVSRIENNSNEVNIYATTDNQGSFSFLTSVGGSNGEALGISNARKVQVTQGAFRLYQRTKAQLDAITPAVGDMYLCSDCTVPYDTCIATGTAISAFRAETFSAISTAVPGTLVPKGCGTGQ